jgi:selenocysteine lyase/cysteine desulfurase
MTLDIDRLRAETPGCERVTHLNNAGSALPPSVVTDTVVAHLRREELIGGYEAHAEAADRVAAVYASVASLIGARPDQIALVESATSAWDRAFSALTFSGVITPGSRILVSSAEYASNVLPILQLVRTYGCTLEYIPDDGNGVVDVNALQEMLSVPTALVAINHCPSQNGLINNAAGIGKAIRQAGSDAYYLLDACQSIGQLPVDVTAIGADFVSATGRKFLRGPRGTGFLFTSDRALTSLEPFPLDLHAATWTTGGYEVQPGARRFESWEKSYAALLGLGAAVDYALGCGIDALRTRISLLAECARRELTEVPGVQVRDRGGSAAARSGIVTFTVDGVSAADVVARIRAHGINVSLSTPDYARVDFETLGIEGLVRVSPHAYNTEDDITRLVSVVRHTAMTSSPRTPES